MVMEKLCKLVEYQVDLPQEKGSGASSDKNLKK